MSYNKFQSDVSRLRHELKSFEKNLKRKNLQKFTVSKNIENLEIVWSTINNNGMLSDYISLWDYMDLKKETERKLEQGMFWLKEQNNYNFIPGSHPQAGVHRGVLLRDWLDHL